MKTYFKLSMLAFLMFTLGLVAIAQDSQVQTLLNDSIKREEVFFTIQNNPELMKLFMMDMKKNKQSMGMMKAHGMSGMKNQDMMQKMMMTMVEGDTTMQHAMMKNMMCKMMDKAKSDTAMRTKMMNKMMGNMMKMTESDPAARKDMMMMMMANMHNITKEDPALQKEMMNKMMGKMMSKAESDPEVGKKIMSMMMGKPDMMKMMMQMMHDKGMMDEKSMNKTMKNMEKMSGKEESQSGAHQH